MTDGQRPGLQPQQPILNSGSVVVDPLSFVGPIVSVFVI